MHHHLYLPRLAAEQEERLNLYSSWYHSAILSTGVEIAQARGVCFGAGVCIGDACGPMWFKVARTSKAYSRSIFSNTRGGSRRGHLLSFVPHPGGMMDKSALPICCLRQVGGHSWRHRMFPMSRETIDRRAAIDHRLASGYIRFALFQDIAAANAAGPISPSLAQNNARNNDGRWECIPRLRTSLVLNPGSVLYYPSGDHCATRLPNLSGGNTKMEPMKRIIWKRKFEDYED